MSGNDIENPYSPPPVAQNKTNASILKTLLQRCTAIFLYMGGWVCVGILATTIVRGIGGELPSVRAPEAELTTFQSFSRFCSHYWFTALLFLSPPVCFVTWMLLKRNGFRKTRWALLGLGLAMSPVLLIVAWLIFRPLLFR